MTTEDNTQMLNTGEISRLIGPGVIVPREYIEETLGIQHTLRNKAARMFTLPQVRDILVETAKRMKQAVDAIDEGTLVVPAKPVKVEPPKAPPPAATTTVDDDDEL